MISSCIRSFYLAAFALLAVAALAQDDPDALYRAREDLDSARRAAAIWAERLAADPKDFESAWKLSRAQYWLGTNGLPGQDARKDALEAGADAGRRAVALEAGRPEGHFWKAANLGALAQAGGLFAGLRLRGEIRDALERARAIDPGYLDGSPDRALGRWYQKVPGLFGGSDEKAEAHLRTALAYNSDSVITHLFLAETLLELDRKADARRHLEAAIAAPADLEWLPEDRRFRERARQLLEELKRDQ